MQSNTHPETPVSFPDLLADLLDKKESVLYLSGSTAPEQTVCLPRLLDQKELAKYLGKSIAWCERARWAGEGPRFIKLGRHVRYKAEDIADWINANSKQSSSEVAR